MDDKKSWTAHEIVEGIQNLFSFLFREASKDDEQEHGFVRDVFRDKNGDKDE